jgi:hypothetical protein
MTYLIGMNFVVRVKETEVPEDSTGERSPAKNVSHDASGAGFLIRRCRIKHPEDAKAKPMSMTASQPHKS